MQYQPFEHKADLDAAKDKNIQKLMLLSIGDQVSQNGFAGKIFKAKRYEKNIYSSICLWWHDFLLFLMPLQFVCVDSFSSFLSSYTRTYSFEFYWFRTEQILTGNINTYSEVENTFQPILFASKIRIYPYSQYDRTVCLRLEIVGCVWNGKWFLLLFLPF